MINNEILRNLKPGDILDRKDPRGCGHTIRLEVISNGDPWLSKIVSNECMTGKCKASELSFQSIGATWRGPTSSFYFSYYTLVPPLIKKSRFDNIDID